MSFRNMEPSDGRVGAGGPPAELARQSSIYSLTFDEFQNTMGSIGKDFGSMNMDEFLRNIWTAEESQAMAAAMGVGAGAISALPDGSAGLQRQGSLTLPRTLSQKTVDEVWRDLLRLDGGGGGAAAEAASGSGLPPQQQQQQQRQPTLGEMTLEEFLVRAGVVREDMNQPPPPQRPMMNNGTNASNTLFFGELPSSNNTGAIDLGFGQTGRSNGGLVMNQLGNNLTTNLPLNTSGSRPYVASPLANQQGARGGGMLGMGDSAAMSNGMNGMMQGVVGLRPGGGGVTVAAAAVSPVNQLSSDGLGKGNGDMSSLSPVPYVFGAGLRGRKSNNAVEKVVERRQRRMIKNRESAARSRARKQAYTMELEAEVAKLKEQNQELQTKQTEILEMQKNQVLEIINQQQGPKKRCLRRTQTGPW